MNMKIRIEKNNPKFKKITCSNCNSENVEKYNSNIITLLKNPKTFTAPNDYLNNGKCSPPLPFIVDCNSNMDNFYEINNIMYSCNSCGRIFEVSNEDAYNTKERIEDYISLDEFCKMININLYNNDDRLIKKAKDFAKEAHSKATRKFSSQPYFVHCEDVVNLIKAYCTGEYTEIETRNAIAVAYMHDVIEDCPEYEDSVKDLLFSEPSFCYDSLKCLTNNEKYNHRKIMQTYDALSRCYNYNELTLTIKLCDIFANLKNCYDSICNRHTESEAYTFSVNFTLHKQTSLKMFFSNVSKINSVNLEIVADINLLIGKIEKRIIGVEDEHKLPLEQFTADDIATYICKLTNSEIK